MFRKLSLGIATLAIGAAAIIPAAADAQSYHGDRYAYSQADRDGYNRHDNDRGRDHRYRDDRRCNSGTGGTIIGAIAGGLLGNAVAGYGDRGVGTVVGAGAGALAGHAIARSGNHGYCR